MVRVVIILVLFASLVYAASAILRFLSIAAGLQSRATLPHAGEREDSMPVLLRHVSFGLLLVLMIGVVTGWLGGS